MYSFTSGLEAADLLQKLSLENPAKTLEVPEPTKKVNSCVNYIISNHSNCQYFCEGLTIFHCSLLLSPEMSQTVRSRIGLPLLYYQILWIRLCAMFQIMLHQLITMAVCFVLNFISLPFYFYIFLYKYICTYISSFFFYDISLHAPSVGYDGTGNDWEDYARYMNAEGVEMPHVSLLSLFCISTMNPSVEICDTSWIMNWLMEC